MSFHAKIFNSYKAFTIFPQNSVLPGLICDVLRDLVPIVQLKKREKHPWKSVTFSRVAAF